MVLMKNILRKKFFDITVERHQMQKLFKRNAGDVYRFYREMNSLTLFFWAPCEYFLK